MHPYSTDQEERQRLIIVALAMIALLISLGFGFILHRFALVVPSWLDTPAVFGFFGLLWRAYDIWIWRWGIRSITISGIPNLQGSYMGTFEAEGGYRSSVEVVIKQTASKISIMFSTERATSYSFLASLRLEEGLRQGLHYVYEFRSLQDVESPVRPHWGTAHLTSISQGTLSGWWLSELEGPHLGSLRVSKPLST